MGRYNKFERQSREEYEKEKAEKEEKAKAFLKAIRETEKERIKANNCPSCHKSQLKRFKRTNYPFGRKSKPTISTGKRCPKCNYYKLDSDGGNTK